MEFELFDPDQPFDVAYRRLPHWYQPGVTYFITFRTADSLPAEVLRAWQEERSEWLQQHGIEPRSPDWQRRFQQLPGRVQAEGRRRFSQRFERYLDAGYGECLLRRPELSRLVADSLLHFDKLRYRMGDFVIMPNHVHLIVCLLADIKLAEQCRSWKKFTATQIHLRLGRRGHFWQGESFDHLIRSPEQLAYLQQYVAENPTKANLQAGEYYLYQPKE